MIQKKDSVIARRYLNAASAALIHRGIGKRFAAAGEAVIQLKKAGLKRGRGGNTRVVFDL